jgi:hypothetical protein
LGEPKSTLAPWSKSQIILGLLLKIILLIIYIILIIWGPHTKLGSLSSILTLYKVCHQEFHIATQEGEGTFEVLFHLG